MYIFNRIFNAILLVGILLPSAALAEVYVRVDALGNKSYTNINPNAKPKSIQNNHLDRKGEEKLKSKDVALNQDFTVTKSQQKSRDTKRELILNNELKAEEALLRSAVKSKDEKSQQVHRRNIALLKKELKIHDK